MSNGQLPDVRGRTTDGRVSAGAEAEKLPDDSKDRIGESEKQREKPEGSDQ